MTSSTTESVLAGSEGGEPLHVLWINAGLSCDGDSVELTAATQPSIEEIVLGALPGLPKVTVGFTEAVRGGEGKTLQKLHSPHAYTADRG